MQYNFTQFLDLIVDGTKPHTIRRVGKRRPPHVGEMLQLYTGLRTAKAHKLIPDVPCLGAQPILIDPLAGITLSGKQLDREAARRLMWNDGFRITENVPNEIAFWSFFTDEDTSGGVFVGYLISWRPHEFLEEGR